MLAAFAATSEQAEAAWQEYTAKQNMREMDHGSASQWPGSG